MKIGMLVVLTGISWIFIRQMVKWYVKKRQNDKVFYQVTLKMGDRQLVKEALMDTGNHLREPISGKPVMIADMNMAGELLGKEIQEAIDLFYLTGELKIAGMRLIPYHSVGKKHGILAAVQIDLMYIANEGDKIEVVQPYVAICQDALSGQGNYHVLLHPEMVTI